MSVEFRDHSDKAKSMVKANIGRALTAMGHVGTEMIIDQMNTGYGRPIYQTGDLQRSMTFETDEGEQATTWGTNKEYGPAVHEGTGRMAGRPFLRDAIMNHKDELRDTAKEHLGAGF